MYRDDRLASRAHLLALERALEERRSGAQTLARYVAALERERQRLSHACIWYQNGEKFGFNTFAETDDLRPSARARARFIDADQRIRALAAVEDQVVAARIREITRLLAHEDPRLVELEARALALEEACRALRDEVRAWQERYPDHPPPPEYDPTQTLLFGGGVLLLLLTGMGLLIGLA